MSQRYWDDVVEGECLRPVAFPLSIYRLVVAAGANRDFNAIHHNADYARSSGAPDMYANTLFLQGMWERAVRDYMGPAGHVRALRGFRMGAFNCAGDTVTVEGHVTRNWSEDGHHLVEIELRSSNSGGLSVGPGYMVVKTCPGVAINRC